MVRSTATLKYNYDAWDYEPSGLLILAIEL